jgi:hypothetical protein
LAIARVICDDRVDIDTDDQRQPGDQYNNAALSDRCDQTLAGWRGLSSLLSKGEVLRILHAALRKKGVSRKGRRERKGRMPEFKALLMVRAIKR